MRNLYPGAVEDLSTFKYIVRTQGAPRGGAFRITHPGLAVGFSFFRGAAEKEEKKKEALPLSLPIIYVGIKKAPPKMEDALS